MPYRKPERQLPGSVYDPKEAARRIKSEQDTRSATKELVKALFRTGKNQFWEAVNALPKTTMERLWGRSSVSLARDIFNKRRGE